jgi:hypothetical protein
MSKKEKKKGENERKYYEPVKARLEQVLKNRYGTFHLEITADKTFTNRLKAQVGSHRDIIFVFLKDAAPDITGFIKQDYSSDFIVVEVKAEKLKLDDIYQTRKYAELFEAKYALLASTEEIPEEIKRLSKTVFSLLQLPAYKTLTLVRFDEKSGEFTDWFPENPFAKGRENDP